MRSAMPIRSPSRPPSRLGGAYHFFVTLPDRLYPFASVVHGRRVRWRRSYDATLRRIEARLGVGCYGFKLGAWRQTCHLVGAGLLILGLTYASEYFWGTDAALPAMFVAAMLAITYQEFYYHPRRYAQRFGKSVLDWTSWVAPLGAYLFLFLL